MDYMLVDRWCRGWIESCVDVLSDCVVGVKVSRVAGCVLDDGEVVIHVCGDF